MSKEPLNSRWPLLPTTLLTQVIYFVGCSAPPPNDYSLTMNNFSSVLADAPELSGGSLTPVSGSLSFPADSPTPSFVSVIVESITLDNKAIKRIADLRAGVNIDKGKFTFNYNFEANVPRSPANATIYYKSTVQARDANDKIISQCPAVVSYFKVVGPAK